MSKTGDVQVWLANAASLEDLPGRFEGIRDDGFSEEFRLGL